MSIGPSVYKDAAGRFATGVAVVTTHSEFGYCGVTVSSFVPLSIDPPLVSVSLAKNLRSLPEILDSNEFAVSILREDQRDVALKFARSGEKKWAGLEPAFGPSGTPLIEPNIAAFECAKHACHDAGDHVILVGYVRHLSVADGSPLVYFRGQLSSFPDTPIHAPSPKRAYTGATPGQTT